MTCRFWDQTIFLKKGTSREIIIPVTDQDGNPIDLTNGNALWWVGKSVNSVGADIIIQKDSESVGGLSITHDNANPPLFSLNIFLQATDTEDVEPRSSYYHEARVVDRGFNVYVVAFGTFVISQSMTNPEFIP